jgi:AraC family transcriptional regulator of adaptative response / DNA-3-methyladenine glycosylase II
MSRPNLTSDDRAQEVCDAKKRELYAAFVARDDRLDGRAFVGVSSTGIYCRPTCKARMPKIDNCTFYSSAAGAERAGYRPCLLCRPELAPGNSIVGAKTSLAHRAAGLLEENCGNEQNIGLLAEKLGCTDRHLRRVFAKEFGVTPAQYLRTCRLLLAKSLLTETDLPITEIAIISGFGSIRRFNDLFQKQYQMSPTLLRKQRDASAKEHKTATPIAKTEHLTRHTAKSKVIAPNTQLVHLQEGITVSLGYRPPYRWNEMLDFLSFRAVPGVEAVENGEYLRTVQLSSGLSAQTAHAHRASSAAQQPTIKGWIRVGNNEEKSTLTVTLSQSLLPVLPQVLARVRHLFDLSSDPFAVGEVLISMNNITPDLYVIGLRVPGCFDPFEMAVRAVLGQQITVRAARTLAARFVERFGEPISLSPETRAVQPLASSHKPQLLTHTFPTPQHIAALKGPIADHLGPLGIIARRAQTIQALAKALVKGDLDLSPTACPEDEINKLLALSGIGKWTAHYLAMRALGWPDAFLETDYGVKKALEKHAATRKELLALADTWRPWRGYATVNLWNAWGKTNLHRNLFSQKQEGEEAPATE